MNMTDKRHALRAELAIRRGGIDAQAFDPLPWIWAHASGIRVILDYTSAVVSDREPGADAVSGVDVMADPLGANFVSRAGGTVTMDIRGSWHTLFGVEDNQLARGIPGLSLESINDLISEIMTLNLLSVHRVVDARPEFDVWLFVSTIQLAYWHLADVISSRSKLLRCADPSCNAWFVKRRDSQRFCPPAPFETKVPVRNASAHEKSQETSFR